MNFDISGAKIFLKIPTGIPILGDFLLSETLVVSWVVMHFPDKKSQGGKYR